MAIACLITSCMVVSFHYSLLKTHTFIWKDSSSQYSRTTHIRHQYNRLLRITDLINREFVSLKSVVNAVTTLKIVRYAALATAWRLNLDQRDNLTTLDTIAIYFFHSTNVAAQRKLQPAGSNRDCGRRHDDGWGSILAFIFINLITVFFY